MLSDETIKQWLQKKPKSSDAIFAEAVIVLEGARGESLGEWGELAYRIATADQEEVDLIAGVIDTVRRERRITPAAVVKHCRNAWYDRACRGKIEGL